STPPRRAPAPASADPAGAGPPDALSRVHLSGRRAPRRTPLPAHARRPGPQRPEPAARAIRALHPRPPLRCPAVRVRTSVSSPSGQLIAWGARRRDKLERRERMEPMNICWTSLALAGALVASGCEPAGAALEESISDRGGFLDPELRLAPDPDGHYRASEVLRARYDETFETLRIADAR